MKSRFEYKHPGLYVLLVRVQRAAQATDLTETAYYAGCRSWVDLERDLPTTGAEAVLGESDFDAILNTIDRILEPTALV